MLVAGKRVLAVGVNTSRSHPLSCSHPQTESAFHAEVAVLRQMRYADLSHTTLVVARLMRDGTSGMSKPCTYCWGAIDTSGVGKVAWTTGDPDNPYETWRL